jgi:hypothetical protein
MKTLGISLVVVALLVGVSLLVWPRSHGAKNPQSPPPGSKPTRYSDGGSDWYLGAVAANGTNVPLSNVTIRAVQTTNGMSK